MRLVRTSTFNVPYPRGLSVSPEGAGVWDGLVKPAPPYICEREI